MKKDNSFDDSASSQYGDNDRYDHNDTTSTLYEEHDDLPPPSYDSVFASNDFVQGDGRVEIDLDSTLVRALQSIVPKTERRISKSPPGYTDTAPLRLPLNIVIQIVGSRGDVQPFIALGNELQKSGHRVRIATHDVFRVFVTQSHLEFYPIGGDPEELMSFMVKNPGLIPGMKTLRAGEISKKRKMIKEMLEGCWRSCIESDPVTETPFVADAIIANPPSFAHIHCAQALGIPLHLMFTMPWTATRQFPHPLANLKNPKMEPGIANHLSYAVVEWMTWQGLGDVINRWRDTLDLEPVPMTEGPFLPYTLEIPTTYCWSGALVPRPADWDAHIDVCGFFFRDTPDYKPPPELVEFLSDGPPPIYIGFGSIVIEDPQKMTSILLEAIRVTGVRAVLSKGWSNIGNTSLSRDVFSLGDCPHEWLFQRVSAVCHHGGAGTTACGLRNGRPTAIVPFFGDQPFWGDMIAAAGAGPRPIPHRSLNVKNLVNAIAYCLTPEAAAAARSIAQHMATESGVTTAVQSFHRNLPLALLPCDIFPHLPAVWTYKISSNKKTVRLSKLAAQVLSSHLKIDPKKLGMNETRPITIENRRWDPITGGASAAIGVVYDTGSALGAAFKGNGGKDKERMNVRDVTDSSSRSSSRSRELHGNGEGSSKNAGGNAVARNLGKAGGALLKGGVIDVPFAFTEGLRQAPRMYGDKVRDHGPITDWKSGGIVAGKNFAFGMYDGISGLVMDPIRGHKEEGAAGLVKGIGKGIAGLYFKPLGGLASLMGSPLQGVYKSVFSAIHSTTRKTIAEARRVEGEWLLKKAKEEGRLDVNAVLRQWDALCQRSSVFN